MNFNLKIWRQKNSKEKGKLVDYKLEGISPDLSLLEMLDVLNEKLVKEGKDPVAFDHDCREGICGSCSMVVNGNPHGPLPGTATCQIYMRHFKDGDCIVIEPFRARAFPLIKDLSVDRTALDRIIKAGGFVSMNIGCAQDANNILISKQNSDKAFLAATCVGCGACVAVCKNASAMLFVAAKISHLDLLPQGEVETEVRVQKMVAQMDKEGFGACTNTGACAKACPKGISLETIARMNRKYLKAALKK